MVWTTMYSIPRCSCAIITPCRIHPEQRSLAEQPTTSGFFLGHLIEL